MKKRKAANRAPRLFNPSEILTEIEKGLGRDLRRANNVYALNEGSNLYVSRQISEFRKKFCDPLVDTKPLEVTTFAKFLRVNDYLGRLKDGFKIPSQRYLTSDMPYSTKVRIRARGLINHVLSDFSVEEWFQECKHSGGSSIGVSFYDTSPEAKFSFPISATSRVKTLIKSYCQWDTSLKDAVILFNAAHPVQDAVTIVKGSRATTVEKNDTARRMICVEPTGNMYFQQGLMHMMYKRLATFGLDVQSLPEHHQSLAWINSITCGKATIDWSSASDSVSIELLRELLPPKWFAVIDQVRCTHTLLNGEWVKLNMVSTMGNAVTFPLETLVFWAFAHAVRLTEERSLTVFPEWEDLLKCSVFGDDCIVPTSIAANYITALEGVGFEVNDDKSFYGETEKFRESCGGDYLAGHAVRPYTVRAPTSQKMSSLEPWLYIIFNSVITKYISHFGPTNYIYDSHCFKALLSVFAKYQLDIKLVPSFFPDDAGLKISFDLERFSRSYGGETEIKFSPIYISKHGSVSFKFCRFQYWEHKAKDDGIRYNMALKKPIQSKYREQPKKLYDIRRKGGYVVGRGLTCHWHVPVIGLQME